MSTSTQPPDQVAAKPAGRLHQGQRNALVIFAAFADDVAWQEVPTWGAQLLDPSLPGSLSHFYDTMSLDALHVGGEVGPRVYHARHDASYYLSAEPTQEGKFGEFSLEILAAADAEVDFSRFDNDGPDGIPSSGDDDGLVDAVFIVIANAPANFIIGPATGRGALGNWSPYTTDDQGQGGQPTRVSPDQGTIQQGATFAEAVGSMCHEFGHLLGLPDLFDTAYFRDSDATPEQDSAGIGAWGLMGWGALGWKGTPGPTSLSAWSRQRLGWAEVLRPEGIEVTVELEQVGAAGQVYWVPLSGQDYLLLEYRRRSSTFYDRGIPAEGLLVWHVGRQVYQGEVTPWWKVDLECADGLWADAGFPLGEVANADGGGDNLDFWAHDATYTARHGGNLGDATDPFDGVRYRSFTPDTNPPATSSDGAHGIHLTEITIAGDRLSAQLRMSPPAVELTFLAPVAERVAAGGRVAINFHVANTGGSPATALRAELSTESEVLEILDPSLELSPLGPGDSTIGINVSPTGFPYVRFPSNLEREHTAALELAIYSDGALLARGKTVVTGVPAHRFVATVTDSGGTPLSGITVRLDEPWNARSGVFFTGRARSDSAGVVEFNVPTGTYTLSAVPAEESRWGSIVRNGVWIDGDADYELSLPLTYVLSGVVRDSHGAPVGSQYIIIEQLTGDTRYSTRHPVNSDGTYSIKLSAGEYGISTRPLSGGASPPQDHGRIDLVRDTVLDVTLAAGLSLTVHVVDEEGVGIDGVWVYLNLGNQSSQGLLTRAGEGATLEVLPGSYQLALYEVPPPYLIPRQLPQGTVLQDTSVSLVLERGLALSGRLVDESGETVVLPVSIGGSVSLVDLDDGGSFRASLEPGPAEFAIGVPPGRYRAQVQIFPGFGEVEPSLPSQNLGVVEVRSDTTVIFTVSPGVLVTGHIRGGFGGSGYVQLSASDVYASASLGPDGTFTVQLVPDEYSVFVYFYGGDLAPPAQFLGVVEVTQDTLLAWDLMEDEVVEGRVLDIEGEGVSGLSVYASSSTDGLSVGNGAITRGDGTFAIRLPAARYVLGASRNIPQGGNVTWHLQDLEVPSLGPAEYVLPGGASLATGLTDTANLPIPARVRLYQGTFSLRELIEGTPSVEVAMQTANPYQVELAPGTYCAVLSSYQYRVPRYSRVAERVIVEDESDLVASLPSPDETGLLTGTVKTGDGSEATSATLYAYESGLGLLAEAGVAAGSKYELFLPSGVYEMAARTYSPDVGFTSYVLGRIEVDGDRTWNITLGEATAVAEAPGAVPHRFALEQNYPNPFNAETVIEFSVEKDVLAELTLYDLLGQRVRILFSDWLTAGPHAVRWDGTDEAGKGVAIGVYLYRLEAAEKVAARKLLFLR